MVHHHITNGRICISFTTSGKKKTEITHTREVISVSAPKISLESDKLSHQS